MKIAITGATGFLGRSFLAVLENTGNHKIVIAVRDIIAPIEINRQTTTKVFLDLNGDHSDAFVRLGQPDLLIHLAWDNLTDYMSKDHTEVTLPKHFKFLENMVAEGTKSVFVAGTCLEYGMQSGNLKENMICHPVTPYGHAKNQLCHQLKLLKSKYDFKLTWARVFYIDGDNPHRPTLLTSLRKSVTRGDMLFNMSKGEQVRDFIPVADAISLMVFLALKMHDIGVVNVCSGHGVSVKSYVSKKIKENDWNIKLNLGYYPYPEYEPMAFWGDVQKLNKVSEKNFESRN